MFGWIIRRRVASIYNRAPGKDHREKWLATEKKVAKDINRVSKAYLKALYALNDTSGDMRG